MEQVITLKIGSSGNTYVHLGALSLGQDTNYSDWGLHKFSSDL
jgi:hypothetical protein